MTPREGPIDIKRLAANEGLRLRTIRLRALADAPDAFGSTYDETAARPSPCMPARASSPTGRLVLCRRHEATSTSINESCSSNPINPMTQIVSTVDFDRDGKQIGWLHVPHSVTRSAYGVLPIPVAVIRNGPGPQVLLTAGNHGDEYEGQVVLTRLIQEVQPEQIRGGLIIIPALNQPAVLAAARVSPLDAGNLNRVFPGDPGGGPTWKIADYVEQHLLPRVEVVADFHGGGASLDYRPHASTHFGPNTSSEHKRLSLNLVSKLGVPHVMVFENRTDKGGATRCRHPAGRDLSGRGIRRHG